MDDENRYDPVKYLREPARPDGLEKAALLPGLNTDYKASGTVDNEVSRLVVVMGKDGFRIGSTAYFALQYVHLGIGLLGFTANGQVFSFLFSDLQPKLLTVHGRNLIRIFDYIGLRRMPWIRQSDRDFRPLGDTSDEPVITRIVVEDWTRPDAEQAAALAERMLASEN